VSAARSRGPGDERGFTLIELTIVIVLLALISGLLFPLVANWGQDDLLASARRLSGTVRYLYNEAALSRNEHRLIFDLDAGDYRTRVLEPDGRLQEVEGQGRDGHLSGDTRFQDVVVIPRGKFTAGEVTTLFHPTGWLDETIVHLADDDGRQLTLHFNPLTGVVELFEGYKDY